MTIHTMPRLILFAMAMILCSGTGWASSLAELNDRFICQTRYMMSPGPEMISLHIPTGDSVAPLCSYNHTRPMSPHPRMASKEAEEEEWMAIHCMPAYDSCDAACLAAPYLHDEHGCEKGLGVPTDQCVSWWGDGPKLRACQQICRAATEACYARWPGHS